MNPPTCAVCKRPLEAAGYAPFCSKRCADVDLQRWFSGAYAIAAVEAQPEGEELGVQGGRAGTDPL